MIISTDRKVMFLMVPRTGTNTIRTMFKATGIPLAVCDDNHYGIQNIKEVLDEIGVDSSNLNEYKIFAFYRDPFERCMSVLNYLRRGRQAMRFFHAFYGDSVPISCASRVPYQYWTDEMKELCDRVPMIEVFRKMKWFFERGVYGRSHKFWLDGPVIPLNFADYDNEVSRLLVEFGVDPSKVTIPHINESLTLPQFDALSAAEEAEIREYLQEDYKFLESRGIRFS